MSAGSGASDHQDRDAARPGRAGSRTHGRQRHEIPAVRGRPAWCPHVACHVRYPRSPPPTASSRPRSEEHTSELQSRSELVCRLLLEKKKKTTIRTSTTQKKKKQK